MEADTNALVKYPENPWNCIQKMVRVLRNNKMSCYLSQSDVERNIELGKAYLKPNFAADFLKGVSEVCALHGQLFKKFSGTDFSKSSNEDLYDDVASGLEAWSRTIGYFRGSQMAATQHLANKIAESVTPEESAILFLPPELDATNLEQIEWQEIIQEPYDESRMFRHVEKYPWLVAYHFTFEDVSRTLRERYEYDKANLVQRNIQEEKAILKEKQEEIFKRKTKETRELVELLNQISVTRIQLKSYWAGNDFYEIPIYKEIAIRTGETIKHVVEFYQLDEIKKLLLEGIKITDEEKQKRRKCFVSLWKNGKVTVASGDDAEKIVKEELKDLLDAEGIKELKGVSANPGIVKGVVKILPSNNVEKSREFRSSFIQGEILVTEMTQPNIMDIAKKAGGIITDEGGMLSHAAIISREFGIPCIVGTHKATQVLKDGDVIEVDANKGVVIILEKK